LNSIQMSLGKGCAYDSTVTIAKMVTLVCQQCRKATLAQCRTTPCASTTAGSNGSQISRPADGAISSGSRAGEHAHSRAAHLAVFADTPLDFVVNTPFDFLNCPICDNCGQVRSCIPHLPHGLFAGADFVSNGAV